VNATQRWQFFSARSTDDRLQCIRCVAPAVEDKSHLFWWCPFSQRLWRWLLHLYSLRAGSGWAPGLEHALLGESLPPALCYLQQWWELLRGSLLWQLWLHRNSLVFNSPDARLTQDYCRLPSMDLISCVYTSGIQQAPWSTAYCNRPEEHSSSAEHWSYQMLG
jgi:hypothetical protein